MSHGLEVAILDSLKKVGFEVILFFARGFLVYLSSSLECFYLDGIANATAFACFKFKMLVPGGATKPIVGGSAWELCVSGARF